MNRPLVKYEQFHHYGSIAHANENLYWYQTNILVTAFLDHNIKIYQLLERIEVILERMMYPGYQLDVDHYTKYVKTEIELNDALVASNLFRKVWIKPKYSINERALFLTAEEIAALWHLPHAGMTNERINWLDSRKSK